MRSSPSPERLATGSVRADSTDLSPRLKLRANRTDVEDVMKVVPVGRQASEAGWRLRIHCSAGSRAWPGALDCPLLAPVRCQAAFSQPQLGQQRVLCRAYGLRRRVADA